MKIFASCLSFIFLLNAQAEMRPSFSEAVLSGNISLTKEILKNNPDLILARFGDEKEPVLSLAMHTIPKPKLEMLKFLINSGANINAVSEPKGMSPLMEAADTCHVGAGTYLLTRHHAEIDTRAADGSTALTIAVLSSCPALVELFLKNCANTELTRKGPYGPEHVLQIAKDQDDPDFFDYLHNKQIIKLLSNAQTIQRHCQRSLKTKYSK